MLGARNTFFHRCPGKEMDILLKLKLVSVRSLANTAPKKADSPLPVTSNLRFFKILRLEVIHMSYNIGIVSTL